MSEMKTRQPGEAHNAFRNALIATAEEHHHELNAVEMLAIIAHFAGQVGFAIELQNRDRGDEIAEVINSNILQGRVDAIASARAMPQAAGRH